MASVAIGHPPGVCTADELRHRIIMSLREEMDAAEARGQQRLFELTSYWIDIIWDIEAGIRERVEELELVGAAARAFAQNEVTVRELRLREFYATLGFSFPGLHYGGRPDPRRRLDQ
jgi:hypothetical protein